MIDKATAQHIKDTANIVEVVSDYVHLTRRGPNYMGLCPFYNERSPYSSVNIRRNYCYCFSCHKGGSPVNFIMEKEGISYHDALLHLAKKYGIKVEERELTDEEKEARTERESLMVASEWAMHRMEQDLRDTRQGREVGLSYLYERGVTDEAVKAFHLGYALDVSDHLTRQMLSAGFELDVLRKLGLTGVNSQGHTYDKYRGRVIFPIMNPAGKVVAFGGRDLKGGPAKYINSPESILYTKSHELYGIYQAKSEMVRQDKCYLVEGYLDVIGMWQSGLQNTVASSGTALTDGQINMIHRFTENITLIYDGDKAGIKAAIRGMDMLLNHRMKVKVLLLPDGHDPDSFSREKTPEEFREYIAAHETDVIRFKMQVLLSDIQNDPQQRVSAINSICRTIAHIQDPTERLVYVGECSRMMDIPQEAVMAAVSRAREEVMQHFKRERELKKLDSTQEQMEPAQNSPAPTADATDTTVTAVETKRENDIISRSLRKKMEQKDTPFKTLERELMTLCVRYGYLPLEKDKDLLVVEYIANELEIDNVTFSYSPYNQILNLMLEKVNDYLDDLERYEKTVTDRIAEDREKGIQKIASSGFSIAEIEREEKKLEEELEQKQMEALLEYSRDYPGNFLTSDDNDSIRKESIDLIAEKHTLSNIYAKKAEGRPEDRVFEDALRAITVYKNELLEIKLKNLMEELNEAQRTGDMEATGRLQLKILKYNKVRAEVAKHIGERIISPRLKGGKRY